MKIPSAATAAVITLACLAAASITVSLAGPVGPVTSARAAQESSVEHGRYLVSITGCNDCHTPGYLMTGKAPEDKWLVGSPMGFQGPWGTSYPANLRLTVQSLTEAQWLVFARAQRRPPMPWFSLAHMSDRDLIDIYRFIRSLGPTGELAPAAVPPGGKVNTPYIVMEPQNLGGAPVSQAAPLKSEPRG